MKYSGIGGQAVLEGVMMKNGTRYAVACRREDGTIALKDGVFEGFSDKHAWARWPFVRGVFAFIDSLRLGMSTLTWSADVEEGTEEREAKKESSLVMTLTIALAVVLAVGLFMLLPVWLASLFSGLITSPTLLALVEGLIRLLIFLAYVRGIAFMKDIERVFMYHGAEHKCINCVEHGLPLTVENVRISSRRHKRCGTSFLLIIMVISILVFAFVHVESLPLRLLSRVLLVPVIAGLSYEFLRLAGRTDGALINALSKPGLWLQALTTREPDDAMIEVGIASVDAVFDWRTYLSENFPESAAENIATGAE